MIPSLVMARESGPPSATASAGAEDSFRRADACRLGGPVKPGHDKLGDWLSPLGTDWCGESSLPCFTGGHVPGDFRPGEENYSIGPADRPVRVRIVYSHLSGNSPLLGVVTLPDGRVTTDVWRRDGSHRSLNPMLTLRTDA